MGDKKPDFKGWATKYNELCSDGRTILPGAFDHYNGRVVPLAFQHEQNSPLTIIGHGLLEASEEGLRIAGFLNNTEAGLASRELISHGDVKSLSIYAKRVQERNRQVYHGDIHEVSLVLGGANPEAYIDYVDIQHSDDGIGSEAIIVSAEPLVYEFSHSEEEESMSQEETEDEELTVEDVLDTFTEDQRAVLDMFVDAALNQNDEDDDDEQEVVEHSETEEDKDLQHSDTQEKDSFKMSRNVFDQNKQNTNSSPTLTRDQFDIMVKDAKRLGSFKESYLMHMDEFGIDEETILAHADYGITNIGVLFPDAKATTATPQFIQRNTEWADLFMSRARKLPFSNVKTILADITGEEARALGYTTGNVKKNEVIKLLKRKTQPTTVYKKQKLDRDNVIDITSMDVVVWLKGEMRMMIKEEIARAAIFGDGRDTNSDDHIADPIGQTDGTGVRSIINDHDLYAHKVQVPVALGEGVFVERVIRAFEHYRGSGNTTMYISQGALSDILLEKDRIGRRLYNTVQELATAMLVNRIITSEVMPAYPGLVAVIVDESDYDFGSDKGGELTLFDDFDLDINQMIYLMETRLSGGLARPKSALVFTRTIDNEVLATMPSFNDNEIEIPVITGVEYRVDDEIVTGTLTITKNTEVIAYPTTGYMFPLGMTRSWTYTFTE